MYVYYQETGGQDEWVPTQADADLSNIRPAFVTILALDTLLEKDSPQELKLKTKYFGPMYFDLDSPELEESITAAKRLVAELEKRFQLTSTDMEIFLSGKKGLHITIPMSCFMLKPVPTMHLPAIYKEMAYVLGIDCVDYRVYTASRGRQFRTTYRQRDNGAWKVPITREELRTLTVAEYEAFVQAPRQVAAIKSAWRGAAAIWFDGCQTKVAARKSKPMKPVSPAIIQQHTPLFNLAAAGTKPITGGFQQAAFQLALFARDSGLTEENFIKACEGLILSHVSDGSRYHTPQRRQHELVRMYHYLADNAMYQYSLSGLKSITKEVEVSRSDEPPWEGAEGGKRKEVTPDNLTALEVESEAGAVARGETHYIATRGENTVVISNFVFTQVVRNVSPRGDLESITARLLIANTPTNVFRTEVTLDPTVFTSSSALQNAVSVAGGTFTGSDNNARGILQMLLGTQTKPKQTIESEGVNLVEFGALSERRRLHIVWADAEGIRCKEEVHNEDRALVFNGQDGGRGLFRSDLLASRSVSDYMADPQMRQEFILAIHHCLRMHNEEVMGRLLGWCVAAYYAPLFHKELKKFPLLHVYGPAGNGKTETVNNLFRLFYTLTDVTQVTPASTVFAMQMHLASSASIPLLVDEYKPHVMTPEKLNAMRALFRDSYNAKTVMRGGSSSKKTGYGHINTMTLAAPVAFIAEAPESETAIVERSVMVSFKRMVGRKQAEAFQSAMAFAKNTEPLTAVGLQIAQDLVQSSDWREPIEEFLEYHAWAQNKFLPAADDYARVEAGEMPRTIADLRAATRPRVVFNNTVAYFGITRLRRVLEAFLTPEEYKMHFEERLKQMCRAVFMGMENLSGMTVPEYVKVLTAMAEMTTLPKENPHKLKDGEDFSLSELAGRPVLVLTEAQAYRKYRSYMRATDSQALYGAVESFKNAITDIPQYVRKADKTHTTTTPCFVLWLDDLYAAGVPKFMGNVVRYDF